MSDNETVQSNGVNGIEAAADSSSTKAFRVWVIAAGEAGSKWSDFQAQGVVAINWAKLGDLQSYASESKVEEGIKAHYRKADAGRPMNDTRTCYDFAHSIAEGDYIVAKQGVSTILGIGQIKSAYQFDPSTDPEWPHRRSVDWAKTGSWTLPEGARVPIKTLTDVTTYAGFRQFLDTIWRLETTTATSTPSGFPGFSEEAFQLLRDFRTNPVAETYTKVRDKFQKEIAEPLGLLVEDLLPAVVSKFGSAVETQKNLTSRIHKNDYGKGGIHSHYWMAFFPKGFKRTTGTQLFIYLHPDHISAGFATGAKADAFNARLKRSFDEADFDFPAYIDHLSESGFHLADFDEGGRREGSYFDCSLSEVTRLVESNSRLVVEQMWPSSDVSKLGSQLGPLIHKALTDIFPLFAMASFDDYDRYLADETDASGGVIEPAKAVGEPFQAPSLTTEQGWSHLQRQLHWSAGCSELSALRTVVNRGLTVNDHASKQIILFGPPGTGKTRLAKSIAAGLATSSANIAMVQFHQSYSYEDFIEGIRPKVTEGQMTYQEVAGPFVEFCRLAARQASRGERYVFIVDEINRGNVSRIFGELLYLLEYRNESLPLLYSKTLFSIPDNVFIIATMNSADRSLALVDYALRRRFRFLEVLPNADVLRSWYQDLNDEHQIAVRFFEILNRKLPDPRLRVGHSYFLDVARQAVGLNRQAVEEIWTLAVRPLLQEYFAPTPQRLSDFDFRDLWQEAVGKGVIKSELPETTEEAA